LPNIIASSVVFQHLSLSQKFHIRKLLHGALERQERSVHLGFILEGDRMQVVVKLVVPARSTLVRKRFSNFNAERIHQLCGLLRAEIAECVPHLLCVCDVA